MPHRASIALGAALVLTACRERASAPQDAGAPVPTAASATATATASAAPPGAARPRIREGGALALSAAGDALYVADEDHGVVRVVPLPLDASSPRVDVKVPGAPAQVVVLADRVLVTVRDPGLLLVMRPDPAAGLVEAARVALPADAWGVTVTPDDALAVVTSAWTHKVSVVDLAAGKQLWTADVAREPRGVVITPDGARAYVTHLVASALTRVTGLAGPPAVTPVPFPAAPLRVRKGAPGDATLGYAAVLSPEGARLFAPRLALDADGKRAWNGQATVDVLLVPAESPLAVPPSAQVRYKSPELDQALEFGTGRGPFADLEITGGLPQRNAPFAQPRAVVYRRGARTLLLASEGTDALVELDALSIEPAGLPLRTYDLGTPRRVPSPGHVAALTYSNRGDGTFNVVLEDGTRVRALNNLPERPRIMGDMPVGVALPAEKGKLASMDEELTLVRKPGASQCGAPSGVALAPDERTAWVFCRSTDDLAVVPLDALDGSPYHEAPLTIVRLGADPLPEPAATGRRLFYDAADDGLSEGAGCASCHPEGRDDGHVWREVETDDPGPNPEKNEGPEPSGMLLSAPITLPFGGVFTRGHIDGEPRQTPMLTGRVAARGPYGWHGRSPDLVSRILRGERIHRWGSIAGEGGGRVLARVVGTPKERAVALAAFVRAGLVAPPHDERPLTADEERGKQIFLDRKTACASCHIPASGYTDRSVVPMRAPRVKYDKSGPVHPDTETNRWFNTPSLLFIGGTPPYYHDGSAPTLEVLIDENEDRMGHTSHLSPDDRRALVAFLRTL